MSRIIRLVNDAASWRRRYESAKIMLTRGAYTVVPSSINSNIIQGAEEKGKKKVITKEELFAIIEQGDESANVDFKREFYSDLKESDFAKDVVAFANCNDPNIKIIVFGIDDKTRQIVGIAPPSLKTKDNIDEFISGHIEPFVNTYLGFYQTDDGKYVGYLEINESKSKLFTIKSACGKKSSAKPGDIYIRKGTTNQRASRNDVINMCNNIRKIRVAIYGDYSTLEPVHISNFPMDCMYGTLDVEFFNETNNPILINDGYVDITYKDAHIQRQIRSISNDVRIQDKSYQLKPVTRDVLKILYCPGSKDILIFDFDFNGFLDEDVSMSVVFTDTDGNTYISQPSFLSLIAKGETLKDIKEIKCKRAQQRANSEKNMQKLRKQQKRKNPSISTLKDG